VDGSIVSSFTSSVTVRLIVVAVLSVALFVPLMMVWALVGERSGRRDEVAREVSAVWGGRQHVGSLALVIPIERGAALAAPSSMATTHPERRLVVLPETLDLDIRVEPEIRRRSIFEVVVYRAHIVATGEFRLPEPGSVPLTSDETLQPDRAFLHVGIADLRGVVAVGTLIWNEGALSPEPAAADVGIGPGLSTRVDVTSVAPMPFRIEMTVAGADALMLMPSGKQTSVRMVSAWPSPAFTGVRLPEAYDVGSDGFTAQWQSTFLSRPFPQTWIGSAAESPVSLARLSESTFGVDLVTPVDHYRQTERAVKYGFLFIVFTFGVVLAREVTTGRRVHPVQYLFVGLALVVFYLLLLSIGEQVPFWLAYAIGAGATIALVGAYAAKIFGRRNDGLVLTSVLTALYGTLFVLLSLEDLALLVGAVMVFVILALAMYLTRGVHWYGTEAEVPETTARQL
jgi:inner membrane protein